MRIFILNFFIGIFSSDDTEFILRFPAVAITHGFSQMRPVRSLQIPPEVGKSPTDFTDIHRFLGDVFCHADFADDADFSSGIFSLDDTEFILRFPAVAITHGFSQMRPVRSLQIPQRLENVPQISQIYTDFSWDVFFSPTDFADDADFSSGIFSLDDTEFILRFPAETITHGFLRMRPVRSLQIPPEVGQRDSPEIP